MRLVVSVWADDSFRHYLMKLKIAHFIVHTVEFTIQVDQKTQMTTFFIR